MDSRLQRGEYGAGTELKKIPSGVPKWEGLYAKVLATGMANKGTVLRMCCLWVPYEAGSHGFPFGGSKYTVLAQFQCF